MSGAGAHLRLGTRGSLLARAQSELIAQSLRQRGAIVEIVIIKTTGDRVTDKPLHDLGGKGLFTKEIEQALLDGSIDFAVHSFKDVPVTMPLVDQSELVIAAIPAREDSRDILVSRHSNTLGGLARRARIGTSSLRRRCQVLAIRNDFDVQFIRGNIDTRINKLRAGDFDAIILAMAGVKRANIFDPSLMHPIPIEEILPAPGQGALALQCRRDDEKTRALLTTLNDPTTALCVELEREIVKDLHGDCHSPIAALATQPGETIHLRAAIGARDGGLPVIRASAESRHDDPQTALLSVLTQLHAQGVKALLATEERDH